MVLSKSRGWISYNYSNTGYNKMVFLKKHFSTSYVLMSLNYYKYTEEGSNNKR